ncbi:glycosyltransferase [uncultured Maricaulis sp.]|uniref:glycosyltransferase n=1 Tax=uncultured Maricaulis sp. TaxID=174710 RepID=UPI00262E7CDE|nr:glycosyltransferase [uncultured Maricaulis sp.]
MALLDGETELARQAENAGRPRWRPLGGRAFRPTRVAAPPPSLARIWSETAALGLPRRAPEMSAFGPVSRKAGRIGLAALAVSAVIGALLPGPALAVASLACCSLFTALIVLRIGAISLAPEWMQGPACADQDLPTATVMVALYREAAVLPQLAASLAAIDYPRDRIAFKLVLEADDKATIDTARGLALDDRFEIVIVPPGEPRTKPRALNYALRLCRSELVTVHDAEDHPHPDQLRRAAEVFRVADPRLACLQAPLNWYNRHETWLTRQFALEYAAHFHALLPLYQRLGWPLPLGGTSNHFRRDALLALGGWDAWNVTEDADLGLRLHAAGCHCGLIEPLTEEEAPLRLSPWIKQRTRWIKGYAQTIAVLLANPRTPWRRVWPGVLVLGGAAASALLHAPLSLICLGALLLNPSATVAALPALAFMAVGYASAIACAAVAVRRAGLPLRRRDLAAMPAYWLLQTLAALRALRQLILDPHHWEKTEHGVSALTGPSCISASPRPLSDSPCASVSSCSRAGGPVSPSARKRAPASSPGP